MKRPVDLKIQELVGKLICERRVEVGVTQLQLVSEAGEGRGSPSWLRQVETGEVACGIAGIYRIFAALGLEPRDALPTLEEVGLEPRTLDLPDTPPLRSIEGALGGLSHSEHLAQQGEVAERRLLDSRRRGEPTPESDPEPDAA